MAQTLINNGDSGLTVRNAINNNFSEVYSSYTTVQTTSASWASSGATNMWIPAAAWIPNTLSGCGVDSRSLSANNYDELLFDPGSDEFAQALVVLPNNYTNTQTVSARFYWTASSGSGNVTWGLQGIAFSDSNTLSSAVGTAQVVNDSLININSMHVTAPTPTVTLAGTPAANRPILFQIYRDSSADNTNDTLAVDARLLGVEILFN